MSDDDDEGRTLLVDVEMNSVTCVLHLFIRFIILSVRKHTHTRTHIKKESKRNEKRERKNRSAREF